MRQATPLLTLIRTLDPPRRASVPPSTPKSRTHHRAEVLCFQAHAELVAGLAVITPDRIIGFAADAIDIESRGKHLQEVLAAVAKYVKTIVDDTNEYVALGPVDGEYLQNFLTDMASEVVGSFNQCAERATENQECRGGSVS